MNLGSEYRTGISILALALVIIFLRADVIQPVQAAPDVTDPVADAGPDLFIDQVVAAHFDGSGSTDDRNIDRYVWTFEYEGETVKLEGVDAYFMFQLHGEYTVTLNVTDTKGNWDTDQVLVTVITRPGPPINLLIIGRSSWIDIRWDHPADNGGAESTDDGIYRGTTPDELVVYLGVWPSTIDDEMYDPYVQKGVTYYYAMASVNSVGIGPMSEVANASAISVPEPPQNLTVEVVAGKGHLSWDEPEWATGVLNVTGYQVHRGTDPDWLYDTMDAGLNTTYVDDTAEKGKTYYYAVGALSELGGGAVSEVMDASIKAAEEDNMGGLMTVIALTAVAVLVIVLLAVFKYEGRIIDRLTK
jgi:hypothetical protein